MISSSGVLCFLHFIVSYFHPKTVCILVKISVETQLSSILLKIWVKYELFQWAELL